MSWFSSVILRSETKVNDEESQRFFASLRMTFKAKLLDEERELQGMRFPVITAIISE